MSYPRVLAVSEGPGGKGGLPGEDPGQPWQDPGGATAQGTPSSQGLQGYVLIILLAWSVTELQKVTDTSNSNSYAKD